MTIARVGMGDQFRVTIAGHSFISRIESDAGEQTGIPHDLGLPDVAISCISRSGARFRPLTGLNLSIPWWLQIHNKAIRDGKYLARPIPVLGNVHTIKIEKKIWYSFVTSFLCSLEFLYY